MVCTYKWVCQYLIVTHGSRVALGNIILCILFWMVTKCGRNTGRRACMSDLAEPVFDLKLYA